MVVLAVQFGVTRQLVAVSEYRAATAIVWLLRYPKGETRWTES